MKLELLKSGRPVGRTAMEWRIENRKEPSRCKDHPSWQYEDKPWTNPPYPGRGQHSSIELHYLYRTAKLLGPCNVANLGTFRGSSASAMAHALKKAGGGTVYAVDIFGCVSVEDFNNGEWTIQHLEEVFAERGLSDYVEFCQGFTQDVVERFTDTKFKLIFIDADHQYESVKQDFELWSPLLEDDGLISFHDVDISGVDDLTKEIEDEWEMVDHVWKLKTYRKK